VTVVELDVTTPLSRVALTELVRVGQTDPLIGCVEIAAIALVVEHIS
jgi:hypothetical protein